MARPPRGRYRHYLVNCHCCGIAFTASRRDAKYCSERCRKRASRSGIAVWQQAFYCEFCGGRYFPPQPGQLHKYCSKACKQAAYRARKRQIGESGD